jgi:hypothetical protein
MNRASAERKVMTTRADALGAPSSVVERPDTAKLYREGFAAGMLGALAITVWFLIIDTIHGKPLYTPMVLATALFHHGHGLESPETLGMSLQTVLVFTWIHFLVFGLIGGAAARLLGVVEGHRHIGFIIISLFVFFECGFIASATLIEGAVLHALAWPSIMAGNLLAAIVMAVYLQRRHRNLVIEP